MEFSFGSTKTLKKELEKLHKLLGFPPGHFYSPIVDPFSLQGREEQIWNNEAPTGIDLHVEEQLELIRSFNRFYAELPYTDEKNPSLRYYFENDYYTHNEGIALYSMIRLLNPKRIIEIGSGFSSAIMLDVNELFFNRSISLTFIDPFMERLKRLLNEGDRKAARLIMHEVQTVPLDIFQELEKGDILFVDSSHVSKTGSDLNHILFNIVPKLRPGVMIHFHDIFFPFEYPKEWVLGGRNWNENYLLKAFLMYNDKFRIRLFSDFIFRHHPEAYREMPLAFNVRGSSLWLEKQS